MRFRNQFLKSLLFAISDVVMWVAREAGDSPVMSTMCLSVVILYIFWL